MTDIQPPNEPRRVRRFSSDPHDAPRIERHRPTFEAEPSPFSRGSHRQATGASSVEDDIGNQVIASIPTDPFKEIELLREKARRNRRTKEKLSAELESANRTIAELTEKVAGAEKQLGDHAGESERKDYLIAEQAKQIVSLHRKFNDLKYRRRPM